MSPLPQMPTCSLTTQVSKELSNLGPCQQSQAAS